MRSVCALSPQVREVKVALHVAAGVVEGQLPVCREPQIQALEGALRRQLAASQGAALYVAGLPGTGTLRSLAIPPLPHPRATSHNV